MDERRAIETSHHHPPGDVIRSEEHWPGATADRLMTHLAVTEGNSV